MFIYCGRCLKEMNSEKIVEHFSPQVLFICARNHSSGNIGTLSHCICKTSKAIQSEHMSVHNSLSHDSPQKLVLWLCLASGNIMYAFMYARLHVISTARPKIFYRFPLTIHFRILHLMASFILYVCMYYMYYFHITI